MLVSAAPPRGKERQTVLRPLRKDLKGKAQRNYTVTPLVSDGYLPGTIVDHNLVNAWGLTASGTSPWWSADNGTGKSTLYNGNTGAPQALVVSVDTNPTGTVFNGTSGFVAPGTDPEHCGSDLRQLREAGR